MVKYNVILVMILWRSGKLRIRDMNFLKFLLPLILTFLLPLICFADTFTNTKTGEVLYGYAVGSAEDGKQSVQAADKGIVSINMSDWKVTGDRNGRNNKVIVFTFNIPIMYEIETAAMENALAQTCDEGPLFILIKLDSPGGRLDLAQRLCAAIAGAGQTQVVCFVSGGEYGGAISAGAAFALACNKIYMAPNTVIGGATMIAVTAEGGPTSVKKAYGEDVGEKFSSIWQANLASLAEKNGRPGLLARAMVDKDIEVVEVNDGDKRLFINPVNKTASQKLVKTWSQKDSLLTLTAKEAQGCMIADGIMDSQGQLLRELGAGNAEVVNNDAVQQAGKELSRAQLKVKKLREKIDLDIKQLGRTDTRARGMSLIKRVRSNLRQLVVLARQYTDLELDEVQIENEYNSVEAFYQQQKRLH